MEFDSYSIVHYSGLFIKSGEGTPVFRYRAGKPALHAAYSLCGRRHPARGRGRVPVIHIMVPLA
ncbi:MAG TPA: hypothetical protein DCR16_02745 [Lachnospiraceae bacterium]|nr:hypothetical protein [Lachnospiraceae bacterium]